MRRVPQRGAVVAKEAAQPAFCSSSGVPEDPGHPAPAVASETGEPVPPRSWTSAAIVAFGEFVTSSAVPQHEREPEDIGEGMSKNRLFARTRLSGLVLLALCFLQAILCAREAIALGSQTTDITTRTSAVDVSGDWELSAKTLNDFNYGCPTDRAGHHPGPSRCRNAHRSRATCRVGCSTRREITRSQYSGSDARRTIGCEHTTPMTSQMTSGSMRCGA